MNWKDIASAVGKHAPMLGTLIGGPGGAAIGSIVASALGIENTPKAIDEAIKTNPEAALKLRQIEADQTIKLRELAVTHAANEMAASTADARSVNETMQSESQSDHWPTYSWRPAIGFAVATDLIVSVIVVAIAYIGVMFFQLNPELLTYLPTMLGAMAALVGVAMPILGIASYWRGKAQASPDIPTDNRG